MELYITSGDSIDFEQPIKIIQYEKLEILDEKCLLVDLEKELDYHEYGGPKAVSRFILKDRHVVHSDRLHKLNKFSIGVHVLIPKNKNCPADGFSKFSDLFNAAWAEVYDSYEAAVAKEGFG